MVLVGFWGVRQFFVFLGVDLGHCLDGLRWFLGIRLFSFKGF
jgi:hypothetical protein